jgi:hypothetical protein
MDFCRTEMVELFWPSCVNSRSVKKEARWTSSFHRSNPELGEHIYHNSSNSGLIVYHNLWCQWLESIDDKDVESLAATSTVNTPDGQGNHNSRPLVGRSRILTHHEALETVEVFPRLVYYTHSWNPSWDCSVDNGKKKNNHVNPPTADIASNFIDVRIKIIWS